MRPQKINSIVDWHAKVEIIKGEVKKLEHGKDYVILGISVFLLKAQLVEFELKQLISALDIYSRINNIPAWVSRSTRSPRWINEEKWTLGVLKKEIKKYPLDFLNELKSNLEDLVETRNNFVHNLFNTGTIQDLIQDSQMGLALANKVLKNIEEVNVYIKANS